MRIGIPRALLYYKYKYLWEKFFEELGIETIYSPTTTKKTMKDGIKKSIDESCLSSKIFIGHVSSLVGKCDYILVPRICNFGKKEDVCVKFNALYDNVKAIFKEVKLITYDVDVTSGRTERNGFIEMGMQLGKSYSDSKLAYLKALRYSQKMHENDVENQIKKISESKNKKVLLVAHPYNAFDPMVGENVRSILNKMNIDVFDAELVPYDKAIKLSKNLTKDLYWTYSKILIGSILYYKQKMDGIIFLSTFPCGLDSITNDLIMRKLPNTKKINIIIDEQSGNAGLQTRLESFVDILNESKSK